MRTPPAIYSLLESEIVPLYYEGTGTGRTRGMDAARQKVAEVS